MTKLLLVFILALLCSVYAQKTAVYNSATCGAWSLPTSWENQSPPVNGDIAVVWDAPQNCQIEMPSQVVNLAELRFGASDKNVSLVGGTMTLGNFMWYSGVLVNTTVSVTGALSIAQNATGVRVQYVTINLLPNSQAHVLQNITVTGELTIANNGTAYFYSGSGIQAGTFDYFMNTISNFGSLIFQDAVSLHVHEIFNYGVLNLTTTDLYLYAATLYVMPNSVLAVTNATLTCQEVRVGGALSASNGSFVVSEFNVTSTGVADLHRSVLDAKFTVKNRGTFRTFGMSSINCQFFYNYGALSLLSSSVNATATFDNEGVLALTDMGSQACLINTIFLNLNANPTNFTVVGKVSVCAQNLNFTSNLVLSQNDFFGVVGQLNVQNGSSISLSGAAKLNVTGTINNYGTISATDGLVGSIQAGLFTNYGICNLSNSTLIATTFIMSGGSLGLGNPDTEECIITATLIRFHMGEVFLHTQAALCSQMPISSHIVLNVANRLMVNGSLVNHATINVANAQLMVSDNLNNTQNININHGHLQAGSFENHGTVVIEQRNTKSAAVKITGTVTNMGTIQIPSQAIVQTNEFFNTDKALINIGYDLSQDKPFGFLSINGPAHLNGTISFLNETAAVPSTLVPHTNAVSYTSITNTPTIVKANPMYGILNVTLEATRIRVSPTYDVVLVKVSGDEVSGKADKFKQDPMVVDIRFNSNQAVSVPFGTVSFRVADPVLNPGAHVNQTQNARSAVLVFDENKVDTTSNVTVVAEISASVCKSGNQCSVTFMEHPQYDMTIIQLGGNGTAGGPETFKTNPMVVKVSYTNAFNNTNFVPAVNVLFQIVNSDDVTGASLFSYPYNATDGTAVAYLQLRNDSTISAQGASVNIKASIVECPEGNVGTCSVEFNLYPDIAVQRKAPVLAIVLGSIGGVIVLAVIIGAIVYSIRKRATYQPI